MSSSSTRGFQQTIGVSRSRCSLPENTPPYALADKDDKGNNFLRQLGNFLDVVTDAPLGAQALVAASADETILNKEMKQAREAHVRALKDIKRAACAERDSHVARVRHELETLRHRARRTVHKERKRSRAYKAQAIEAHKRGLRARHALQARASAATVASMDEFGGGRGRGMAGVGWADVGVPGRTGVDSMSTFGTVGNIYDCVARRGCFRRAVASN